MKKLLQTLIVFALIALAFSCNNSSDARGCTQDSARHWAEQGCKNCHGDPTLPCDSTRAAHFYQNNCDCETP